jgi:hypothetical protein
VSFQSNCVDVCLNPSEQPVDPILIWVDEVDPPKAVKDHLWRGCRCCRFRKLLDAISFMRNLDNDKAILIITVRAEICRAILETLKDVALLNEAEQYPRIETLLVLNGDVTDDDIDQFRSMGAEVRFRLDPEDVEKCLQYLRRRLMRPERQAILELVYIDAEEIEVYLRGPRGRVEFEIGHRLIRTIEILAEHRVIDTQLFANELGVSVKTPKKYMEELRNEYDRVRVAVGETIPAKKVFVSQRLPGGWVHRLKAKIVK